MFGDISEGRPPIEGGHVESKHYSSILLKGYSRTIYVETIPLRRGPERQLNHTVVKRASTHGDDLLGAKLTQSHLLIGLEDAIKMGKTAKQALIDALKPTPE
ncbi:MAG: hypothetical protein US62_C0037G0007 [Candidatus Woesebacteria bacterium GW2011_GWA1_37_8]|uniref:Uncharacterized protein n=2 Tax=Candidatus Woeseibacteriota TaxID=1752722 RepID=A0A0G0NL48_9BACT|nr:MAG: hypothetical protein US39_C0014G0036 [Microgenomates group bacterium GW2011_GWC1_37_12b]KKQ43970.1 MAG: hypothetical protein US62_C0037G0007 [Candidatus Woesebacteria bacterium GW2011_GWA1_37_8]KKQ86594.1 MAG: hypothetical protein UT10_C0021G0011 [Candidatus Woesebacteria bacterium GW2011_GWB1_38_8b]